MNNRNLLQFLVRLQILSAKTEGGYVLVLVSMVTFLMFGLLSVFVNINEINKSTSLVQANGNSAFYSAESGLNIRAEQIRSKFDGYHFLKGMAPKDMSECFTSAVSRPTSNDFECRSTSFESKMQGSGGSGNSLSDRPVINNFNAYTYISDDTKYRIVAGVQSKTPALVPIEAGDPFAGLFAQEYKYTVHSAAGKSSNSNPGALAGDKGDVSLELATRLRLIPLFQFGMYSAYYFTLVAYGGDNTFGGKIHSNGNLKFWTQPGWTLTVLDRITMGGSLFQDEYNQPSGTFRFGLTSPNTYANFVPTGNPDYLATGIVDIKEQSNDFQSRIKDNVPTLEPPEAGFLRKRSYYKSENAALAQDRNLAISTYWSKADIRLEMVPDRDVTAGLGSNGRWTRNEAIIPFNVTSVQTGGTGACSTTPPMPKVDPDSNYIDGDRDNAAALKCRIFTKGQLQSLRQPVMVLTSINQSPSKAAGESATLGAPTLPSLGSANVGKTTGKEELIVRALQVALAATSRPVPLDSLAAAMDRYSSGTPQAEFKAAFNAVLTEISGFSAGDLDSWSPNQIAALKGAWFLRAPIQRPTSDVDTNTRRANSNVRSAGFYNSLSKNWITMLQTDILSLSVWNRDGVYVEPIDSNLRIPYQVDIATIRAAFNRGNPGNLTNNLLFVRELLLINKNLTNAH